MATCPPKECCGASGASRPKPPAKKTRRRPRTRAACAWPISVGGVTDLMFRLSRCCAPVPGDPIVGFVTRGRGIAVHRADCPNVAHYAERDPGRVTSLEWTLGAEAYFPVAIQVDALDRVGLVSDITTIISGTGTNILQAQMKAEGKPRLARLTFTLEVRDLEHLESLMSPPQRAQRRHPRRAVPA